MKRELKVSTDSSGNSFKSSAAAQIPMKRELKVLLLLLKHYNLNLAAAQIPMKRELKVCVDDIQKRNTSRCSPNPYEEGTESR